MILNYLLLLLGVFACSTSVLWIKASHAHPVVLVAFRLCLASVFLAPLAWRDHRKHPTFGSRKLWTRTFWPAVFLAAHFISWTYGARMTAAAQATLIVNLVPVAMPFALHRVLRERINRAEIAGTIIAVLGMIVLTYRDALSGSGNAWGNLVCCGSLLLFTGYLVGARLNRDFPSIWLYVVPIYFQAGVLCLIASIPWLTTFQYSSMHEVGMIAGLALVPTIIGHSLLNDAMRFFRGQTVSLCNGTQFIFAGITAYFLMQEKPAANFYVAAILILIGMAVVVLFSPPRVAQAAAQGQNQTV